MGASGPAGGWLWSSGRVFPPFVLFPALLSVHCLQIWLYFAFLGGFSAVLGRLCGFVWLACFAWLVGLCTRVELGGLEA